MNIIRAWTTDGLKSSRKNVSLVEKAAPGQDPFRSQVIWFSCITPLMLCTHISFFYLRRYINLVIDSVDRQISFLSHES